MIPDKTSPWIHKNKSTIIENGKYQEKYCTYFTNQILLCSQAYFCGI